jgi:hypothetical protein
MSERSHLWLSKTAGSIWPAALLVVVAATLAMGCRAAGTENSTIDCISRPTDPVDMVGSWSSGAAFVIATVGGRDGSTRVYDPGYQADVHAISIDEVLFDPTGNRVNEASEIANVHYPSNECLVNPAADLETGRRLLLVLAPPDPSKDVWTVDGAGSVLTLSAGSGGEDATWQGAAPNCAGHLRFSLSAIAAALGAHRESPLVGTCEPK